MYEFENIKSTSYVTFVVSKVLLGKSKQKVEKPQSHEAPDFYHSSALFLITLYVYSHIYVCVILIDGKLGGPLWTTPRIMTQNPLATLQNLN